MDTVNVTLPQYLHESRNRAASVCWFTSREPEPLSFFAWGVGVVEVGVGVGVGVGGIAVFAVWTWEDLFALMLPIAPTVFDASGEGGDKRNKDVFDFDSDVLEFDPNAALLVLLSSGIDSLRIWKVPYNTSITEGELTTHWKNSS